MTPGEALERSEIEAVLEARRELGLRYDAELSAISMIPASGGIGAVNVAHALQARQRRSSARPG